MALRKHSSDAEVDLVAAEIVLNELMMLLSCCLMSYPREDETCEVTKKAQFCQAYQFLLYLTGKCCEAWKLINSSFPRGAQREIAIRRLLGESALDTYRRLAKLMGAPNSAMSRVRNEVVFHYNREKIQHAFDKLNGDEELEFWVSKSLGSSRSNIGAILAHAQVRHLFGGEDPKEYLDLALKVSHLLEKFLDAWIFERFKQLVLGHHTEVALAYRPPARLPALVTQEDMESAMRGYLQGKEKEDQQQR